MGGERGSGSAPPWNGGEAAKFHTRKRDALTNQRARGLRRGDNMAEAILWGELKGRKLAGHKFVRQFPIGPYFADFCCRERRLVVELDGSQHADSAYDRARDEFMRLNGFSVLRFWSHETVKDLRGVCETTLAAIEGRLVETVASDLRFVAAKGKDAGR